MNTQNLEATDKPRVLLVGAYGQGNFGDDLMARLFVDGLSKLATVFLSGSTSELAKELRVQRHTTQAEPYDVVVFGGGGHLVSERSGRVDRIRAARIETTLLSGVERARRDSAPVFFSSIGGAGDGTVNPRIAKSMMMLRDDNLLAGVSCRLEPDAEALHRSLGDLVSCGPDVVLMSGLSLTPSNSPAFRSDPPRIGVNLRVRSGVPALKDLVKAMGRSNIRLLATHRKPRSGLYELASIPGLDRRRYKTLEDFLQELADLKVVVSSKLHVGVAAMSVGVPFIAFRPPSKARQFLIDLGLEEHCTESTTQLSRLVAAEPSVNEPLAARLKELRSLAHDVHLKPINRFLETMTG